MKKIYIAILCIAVTLFISCDEQKAKAEDDITKAITKITDKAADVVDAVDKTTPKPQGSGTPTNTRGEDAGGEEVEGETETETAEDTPPPVLIKPVVSTQRARVGTAVIFSKVEGHSYELKEQKTGVTLSEGTSNTMQVTATQAVSGVIIVATLDGNTGDSEPIEFFVELTKPVFFPGKSASWGAPITFPKVAEHTYELKEEKTGVAITEYNSDTMEVTATQSAQNVIVVATFDGRTSESDPIEFMRVPGNTLSFQYNSLRTSRGTITSAQIATKSGVVAGDTRNIQYSVSPTGQGVTIGSSSGAVALTSSATVGAYTITAELPQTEKYTRATATYTLEVDS